jgi:hypothetical protein
MEITVSGGELAIAHAISCRADQDGEKRPRTQRQQRGLLVGQQLAVHWPADA